MRLAFFPMAFVLAAVTGAIAQQAPPAGLAARTPEEHQRTANHWLAEAVSSLQEASELREQAFIDLTKGSPTGIREEVNGIIVPLEGSFASAKTACIVLESWQPADGQIEDVRLQLDEIARIRDELENQREEICSAQEPVSPSVMASMRKLQAAARAAMNQALSETSQARDDSVSSGMPRTVQYVLGELREAGDSLGELEARLLAEAPARRAVEKLNSAQERIENSRHLLKMASELIEPYRSQGIALDSDLVLEAGTLVLEVKDVDDGLVEARQYETELLMALSSEVGDGQRQVGLWQRELEECAGVRQTLSDIAVVDAQLSANQSLVEQMEASIGEAEACATELERLAAARTEKEPASRQETELVAVAPPPAPPSTPPPAPSSAAAAPEPAPPSSAWGKGEVRELEAWPEPVETPVNQPVTTAQTTPAPPTPPPLRQASPVPPPDIETLVSQAQTADESCSYDEALAIMGRIEQTDPFHPWVARHSTEISVKARRSRQAIGELEEAMRLMQGGSNAEAVTVLSRARLNASPCDIETIDKLFRDAADLTNRDRIAKEQAVQQRALQRQQEEQAAQQREAEKREKRSRTWGAIFGGLSGALQTMNMRSGSGGGLASVLGGASGSGKTGQLVQQLAPVVQQTLSGAAGQNSGNMIGALSPMLTGSPTPAGGQTGLPGAPSFAGGVTIPRLGAQSAGTTTGQGACQVSAMPASATGGSVFVFRGGQSIPIYSIAVIRPDLAAQLVAEYQSRGWQQVYGPAMSVIDAQAWVDRVCPPQNRIQIPSLQ